MGGVNGTDPFSAASLTGGGPTQIPSNRLPPEVITGVTASFQKVIEVVNSAVQVTPDKAAQLGMIVDLINRYLSDLQVAGAQPLSPTATGPAFPGGGFDRGVSGAGAI
jgi:hypothetical protein